MCLHFACCCAGGDYFCYACLPVISLSTWSLVNIFWWWVYWVPYPFILPVQVNCVLRLPLHLRLLSSLRSCVLDVVSVLRYIKAVEFSRCLSSSLVLSNTDVLVVTN